MNEIERRIYHAQRGRRSLEDDFTRAKEEVRKAHQNFKSTKSASAQESYAKALRELDITSRCLALVNADREVA